VHRGFSLVELAVATALVVLLAAIGLPRLVGWRDWLAADQAAREITTALATGRHAAVMQATRARVEITRDSLLITRFEAGAWRPWKSWPGPARLGVVLAVSNPLVVFGPTGMGWGVSNTRITLQRGSQVETITVSRVGRVKRW
jgi:prepilin-type N-terminal cleavage/methylation domain-containing protein